MAANLKVSFTVNTSNKLSPCILGREENYFPIKSVKQKQKCNMILKKHKPQNKEQILSKDTLS